MANAAGHWITDLNACLLLGINVAVAGSWLFSALKAVRKGRKAPKPPPLPYLK
jgi:H+/Cl- antiporter ClcA